MRSPAEHPAPFRALERTTRDAALTAHGPAFRAGMFMPDFPSCLPADRDGLVFRARDAVLAIPTLDEVLEADVAAGENRAPANNRDLPLRDDAPSRRLPLPSARFDRCRGHQGSFRAHHRQSRLVCRQPGDFAIAFALSQTLRPHRPPRCRRRCCRLCG